MGWPRPVQWHRWHFTHFEPKVRGYSSGYESEKAWGTYWTDYVNDVWTRFRKEICTVRLRDPWNIDVTGHVDAAADTFVFLSPDGEEITRIRRPDAASIFCCTGCFPTTNDKAGAIAARIGARFNRTTLLLDPPIFPDGQGPRLFHAFVPTNWYQKYVHLFESDGRGYAIPYDDVTPEGYPPIDASISAKDPAYVGISVWRL